MACADIAMDIEGAEEELAYENIKDPLIKNYQALELMPAVKGPLHDLLRKQPAVLGSLQMVSGLLSVGVGVLFAVTLGMTESLFALFRISHLTGSLFIIAGLISNLLFKYPRLLPICFLVNLGCIAVAAVEVVLIGIDLAYMNQESDHFKILVLELVVLGLEVQLAVILCIWFRDAMIRPR